MKFNSKAEEDEFLEQQWIRYNSLIKIFTFVAFLNTCYTLFVNLYNNIIWTPVSYLLMTIYFIVPSAIFGLSFTRPLLHSWTKRLWYTLLSILSIMYAVGISIRTLLCFYKLEPENTCSAVNRPVSTADFTITYLLLGPILILIFLRNSIKYQIPALILILSLVCWIIFATTPIITILTFFSIAFILGSQILAILAIRSQEKSAADQFISEKNNKELNVRLSKEIDEKTKAQEKAQMEEEKRTQFTSFLFHEMRIPLNSVILSMSDLEADDQVKKTLDKDAVENFDRINKGLKTIIGILNDSLEFRKMNEGKLTITPSPFVLHDMLNELVRSMDSNWTSKKIKFETYFDPKIDDIQWKLLGDYERLKNVLSNYLSNASKFTPEGGSIYLETLKETDSTEHVDLYISVRDTGIGISKKNQEKLFKPFVQIDPIKNQGGRGTGLGLSIVASIINSMGGTFGIKSELGKGSTFWFRIRLPITNVPKLALSASTSTKNDVKDIADKLKTYKILVTDDDFNTRKILSKILSRMGNETEEAFDGLDCIEKITNAKKNDQPFNVLFIDNQMPRLNGLEAIKWLRTNGYDFPIIALTGSSEADVIEEIRKVGATTILIKPSNAITIKETIEKLSKSDSL